jgi:polyisoprenoid-binding protein YceI
MAKLVRRPKTRRGLLLAIVGAVAVVAAGFAVVYFVLFPTSSPKRFALTSSSSPSAAPSPATSGDLAGQWTVASGSQAGYRVREKLAFLSAESDAVGRTSAMSGSATLSGSTITAASFKADVSKLTSDRPMRDQRIHSIGLQSDQFPTATWKLTTPVKLPASFRNGKVLHLRATGVFNIRGTSKSETIPIDMQLSSRASRRPDRSPSRGASST